MKAKEDGKKTKEDKKEKEEKVKGIKGDVAQNVKIISLENKVQNSAKTLFFQGPDPSGYAIFKALVISNSGILLVGATIKLVWVFWQFMNPLLLE